LMDRETNAKISVTTNSQVMLTSSLCLSVLRESEVSYYVK
jgi:hypothetical protein